MMKKIISLALVITGALSLHAQAQAPGLPLPQASSPLFTDSISKQQHAVTGAVFLIGCNGTRNGTGFLHRSGNLITADHVVKGCQDISVVRPDGPGRGLGIPASIVAEDGELDIVVLKPKIPLHDVPLELSTVDAPGPGSLVTTWGFPGGYYGFDPIVSVGYFSGSDLVRTSSGKLVKHWVVNAAFNRGNSGGPLIDVETGAVIGVVDSKIVPLSQQTHTALAALANEPSGVMYTATRSDGTPVQMTEAQVVQSVLSDLVLQLQLVIGTAVPSTTVREFLKQHGIDP
ncbi:S1 family peptidase [Burkholderia anthina]|uniref:S1 family peptidase n=1 Tax=Burkholderia anthina TaxID=179879 RepID=UPI001588D751|nr:serine protease [Burkholderia anthina]